MISKKNFLLAAAFIIFAAGSHVFAQTTPAPGSVPVGKIAVMVAVPPEIVLSHELILAGC